MNHTFTMKGDAWFFSMNSMLASTMRSDDTGRKGLSLKRGPLPLLTRHSSKPYAVGSGALASPRCHLPKTAVR